MEFFKPMNFPCYVLSFSHSDYRISLGGTEKVLHEEAAALRKRNISYIQVYALDKGDAPGVDDAPDQQVGVNIDAEPAGTLSLIQLGLSLQALRIVNRAWPVAVHIHHLMNLSLPGVRFLINAVAPECVRFFVHDYYTICTNHNLLQDNNDYCGEIAIDPDYCKTCCHHGIRKKHFAATTAFFDGLKPQIIAPSQTAAAIWSSYFPNHKQNIRIIPHQYRRVLPEGENHLPERYSKPGYRPRIAYLGYESRIKGLETWWRLCRDKTLKKNYQLYHLGAAAIKVPGVTYVAVSFLEAGPDAMIQALRAHRIDMAFLWSICPETYSFTLAEAFAANCFVVTNSRSGNIAAQVREHGGGRIFEDEAAVKQFLYDTPGVVCELSHNARHSQPHRLEFNPTLSRETQNLASHLMTAQGNRVSTDIRSQPQLASWVYLIDKLDQNAREKAPREASTDERRNLRSQLAVYQQSRVHRLAEGLRSIVNRAPLWGKVLRPVCFFIFDHIAQKIKRA